MPTSSYQADVKVEIAFDSGFGTPAASRTWTDVSTYVELAEGITITGGRQDERSTADANQLSLTFDNSDGRFTSGLVTGPYHPLKLDRPIRVKADPVDGSETVRFLGYVNEWPVEWNGTSAYAKATITASSRLSRLGMTRGLRSVIEIEYLADSPVAYYPLGEPSEATRANDVSGNNAAPLVARGEGAPVVFGNATGPGTDSLTAAEFVDPGQYLSGLAPAIAAAPATFECFFSTSDDGGILNFGTGVDSAVPAPELLMTGGGNLTARVGLAAQITSTGSFNDGATHHAAVTLSGGTLTLYVDGVSAGSVAYGVTPVFTAFEVGAAAQGSVFNGAVAHAAAYDYALSSTRIADHAEAGFTGVGVGELTDVRLERYAGYAGIPVAEVNAETGSTTMAHIDTTDKQVVELMRMVETTEAGVLFDDRDGTLTMHNRAKRYTAASAFTLNMAEQEVEADYAPKLDRAALLNDVTGQTVGNTVSARVTDEDSIDDYGHATGSFETASENPDEPTHVASWMVGLYAEPKVRVPSLSVDVLAQVGKTPNSSAVLAATVGTRFTVSNHPAQAATTSSDYFVEGWTETYGPESLTVTFNVSPSAPYSQVWILQDATYGVLDSTTMLAF